MPKIVDRAEKKKEIIMALCRCMTRSPYQEISIYDIAKEAGINHGLLYYYFKNKDEILLETIQVSGIDWISWMKDCCRDLPEKQKDPDMLFKCLRNAIIPFGLQECNNSDEPSLLIWLSLYSSAISNEAVREKLRKLHQDYQVFLVELLSRYLDTSCDLQVVAGLILQTIYGIAPMYVSGSITYESLSSTYDMLFDSLSLYLKQQQ